MNLRKEIESYLPYNCEEEKDKEIMLKYMDTFDDVLTRNNEIGHFTSSCWIVNKEKTKVITTAKTMIAATPYLKTSIILPHFFGFFVATFTILSSNRPLTIHFVSRRNTYVNTNADAAQDATNTTRHKISTSTSY